MAEIWFYHLERQSLDEVLPILLERTLDRGWRAVVQSDSREHAEALDTLLWTYRDDAFLPHGTGRDGGAEDQPIFLTESDENPNGADVRFLVDGAALGETAGYQRVVYLFDGADATALEAARAAWREARSSDAEATYWRQTNSGKWEKQQ